MSAADPQVTIAKAFPDSTTWTSARGDLNVTARNGSRVVDFTQQTDGTVAVTLWIDYGVEGRSWCDSGTYKTAAGAVRKARGFLA